MIKGLYVDGNGKGTVVIISNEDNEARRLNESIARSQEKFAILKASADAMRASMK